MSIIEGNLGDESYHEFEDFRMKKSVREAWYLKQGGNGGKGCACVVCHCYL